MRLPNFGYHFARLRARIVRRFYCWLLPVLTRRGLHPVRSIDLDVFAYSNEQALPEQVASIRSFLRHAGRPRRFVVVSDGSHSDRSIRLLQAIDPSVVVQPVTVDPLTAGNERFRHYLENHPTGKQLGVIMNLPQDRPALYTDSDVLFFDGAKDLLERLQDKTVAAYYLADCQFAGDDRLLRGAGEERDPVNTGVLLLFRPLDWSVSVARFADLDGAPTFFTNQTMTHLTMHRNSTRPFDPARYILQLDDQFSWRDRYADPGLALRHYVNPVRHKFWTSLN
jgi:hypothetical protein